jgi:hypothetical protein
VVENTTFGSGFRRSRRPARRCSRQVRRSSNRSRCASEVLLGNGFDSTTAGRRRTHRGSRDPLGRLTSRDHFVEKTSLRKDSNHMNTAFDPIELGRGADPYHALHQAAKAQQAASPAACRRVACAPRARDPRPDLHLVCLTSRGISALWRSPRKYQQSFLQLLLTSGGVLEADMDNRHRGQEREPR